MPSELAARLVFDALSYRLDYRYILQGIYLEVQQGQVCGLFGLNGSGKSTLLKIGAGHPPKLSQTIGDDLSGTAWVFPVCR